jgi:hypothetical protein
VRRKASWAVAALILLGSLTAYAPRAGAELTHPRQNFLRASTAGLFLHWGLLPSARGVALIDLPATTTRHVRLEVVNTYAASSDSTRYKRLRVDEAWIGSAYPSGT